MGGPYKIINKLIIKNMDIVKCDMCKKEIKKWFYIKIFGYTGNGLGYQGKDKKLELCDKCMEKLNEFIKTEDKLI